MRKFFIKALILFIPFFTLFIVIIFLPSADYNVYNLAIIDKHRILANAKSPKIVLAGGSNLAFGIDSEKIQLKFNRPVVNMGVHAGFGLGRILDDISPFLNRGDVLLIVPEYDFFFYFWNGSDAAYNLIFDARQYRLLWSSYYGLPNGSFFPYLFGMYKMKYESLFNKKNKIENKTDINPLPYSRYSFNEYGDHVGHLEKMGNGTFNSTENLGIINQTYLKNFFLIIDKLTKRGIIVMLSYPCFEEQSFRNSVDLIHKLDMSFKAKENLLVISTPESYCYPANYFYDTAYHLNKGGRSVRTNQLILDLQTSGLFNTVKPAGISVE